MNLHFNNPPIIEAVIGIQFEPILGFDLASFGQFYELIKSDFPIVEHQSPLLPQLEQFSSNPSQHVHLHLANGQPLPRAFFRNSDQSKLIQLQNDRLIFNWIKIPGENYPHFEKILEDFTYILAKLKNFVVHRDWPSIRVTQCELTRTNIIEVNQDILPSLADAPRVFAMLNKVNNPPSVETENFSYTASQKIQLANNRQIVRLFTTLSPRFRVPDGHGAYHLEFTLRGPVSDSDEAAITSFFSEARKSINDAFLASTTEKAQQYWK
jgi:uncharacterized protein (TIGR04255 family)